jgi:hypothetical protein
MRENGANREHGELHYGMQVWAAAMTDDGRARGTASSGIVGDIEERFLDCEAARPRRRGREEKRAASSLRMTPPRYAAIEIVDDADEFSRAAGASGSAQEASEIQDDGDENDGADDAHAAACAPTGITVVASASAEQQQNND